MKPFGGFGQSPSLRRSTVTQAREQRRRRYEARGGGYPPHADNKASQEPHLIPMIQPNSLYSQTGRGDRPGLRYCSFVCSRQSGLPARLIAPAALFARYAFLWDAGARPQTPAGVSPLHPDKGYQPLTHLLTN